MRIDFPEPLEPAGATAYVDGASATSSSADATSHETAIRQGWIEAYEELLEMCLKLRDRINVLEKNIKN